MEKFKFTNPNDIRVPKYLILLCMLYLTTFIFPVILAYRMVQIGPLLEPGGTMIFPASYMIADIIAEIYGYKISRKLLWAGILCQMLIALAILMVLHLPYPPYWKNEIDFQVVLGHALRYAIASSIGNFFGESSNIYIISKFKVLLKGRYFWLRSLGASFLGEAILTVVVFFITFVGLTSPLHVFELTLFAYLFKIGFACIAVIPATLLVKFLKKNEGIDVYDYGVTFNPFKIST